MRASSWHPRCIAVFAILIGSLSHPARSAVNLVGVDVERPAQAGACDSLDHSGAVNVRVANDGIDAGTVVVDVLVFQDLDGDDLYSAPDDLLLGSAMLAPPLAPGEQRVIAVPVSGVLACRDPVLLAWVDAAAGQSESDETDNVASTRAACERRPTSPAFDPVLEWEWTEVSVDSTPMIGDVDLDGVPNIVFGSELQVLHCLDGRTGAEIWRTSGPVGPAKWASVAIGDIEPSPGLEIVALDTSGGSLAAWRSDGTHLWTSDPLTSPGRAPMGGVTLADLDCDGAVEAIHGKDVFDARTGDLWWTPDLGGTQGTSEGYPGFSTPADIDGDGDLELIAGPTAWDFDAGARRGRIAWTQPLVPEGFTAIGQFDADAAPEVVVVHGGRIWLLQGDTGAIAWDRDLPQGGGGCSVLAMRGGAPTVADFDGDGAAEIGVAVSDWYVVYEGDGRVLWQQPIQDCSSSFTSSTVFDFEDDGAAEVVYQDEVALRVLRGSDGSEIVALPASSLTWMEMVTIGDIDGDNRAEIVSPNNPWAGRTERGIRAWGDRNDNWVNTRRIWNQNAYHVDNVGDAGEIPAPSATACEIPSWRTHGTYRLQRAGEAAGYGLPDLTLSILAAEPDPSLPCTPRHRVEIVVGNGGAIAAGRSTTARVYDGDPSTGGREVASALIRDLPSGAFLTTVIGVPLSETGTLHVRIDDDGVVDECREDNNACAVAVDIDFVPSPDPVGPMLFGIAHGDPNAAQISGTFEWSGDQGLPRPAGDHYHVLRGTRPDALARIPGSEPWTSTTWVDLTPRATTEPFCHYFKIVAADDCEQEER